MEENNVSNTAAFIREHRSNEANFEKLYLKLEQEISSTQGSEKYVLNLKEVKSKAAQEYNTAKQTSGTAWPEFEKFVSAFEKAVVNKH